MKIAQYGATIVVMHAIFMDCMASRIKKSQFACAASGLFVGVVVTLAPIIAAVLVWTQFYRIGSWILLS